MKKIFLLLCLVAGSASASEHWFWRDETGLEFVLTSNKPFLCAGMNEMYSTDPQGSMRPGCWLKRFDRVHIFFNDRKEIDDGLVVDAAKFQRKANSAGQPTAEKTNLPK